jgi:hypothetical protein
MNHGHVAAPLTNSDAALLRRLDVPRSRQWLAASMICGGGFVALVLTLTNSTLPTCTAASPCSPDPGSKAVYTAMAAVMVLAFVQRRLAAIVSVASAAGLIYYNQLHPATAAKTFATVIVVGAAVWSLAWAELSRPRRPPAGWKPDQEKAPDPQIPVRTLPIGALIGIVLVGLGVGAVFYGQSRQASVEAQTRAAQLVNVKVVGHPGTFTIWVDYPPGVRAPIVVKSTRAYPFNAIVRVYVDDHGLRQLVAEPYDGSFFWTWAVGLGLAGIGLFWFSLERVVPRRRLLGRPQPATAVYIRRRPGHVLLFAGEATAVDLPFAELPVRDNLMREFTPSLLVSSTPAPAPPRTDPRMLPPEPATLYGTPIPGRWCTVTVGSLTLSPKGPLRTTQDMLPFGSLTEATRAHSDDSSGGPTAVAAQPEGEGVGERPLTPEERRRIRPEDEGAAPDQVQYQRFSPLIAYLLILAVAANAAWVFGVGAAVGWARVVVGVAVLSAANYLGWRLWLRPMVAWSGGGVAIRSVWRRPTALAWTAVNRVGRVGGRVWIDTAAGVVPANPGLTRFGAGRSPDQLMLAFRQSRLRYRPSLPVPPAAAPSDRRDTLIVWAVQVVVTLLAVTQLA